MHALDRLWLLVHPRHPNREWPSHLEWYQTVCVYTLQRLLFPNFNILLPALLLFMQRFLGAQDRRRWKTLDESFKTIAFLSSMGPRE